MISARFYDLQVMNTGVVRNNINDRNACTQAMARRTDLTENTIVTIGHMYDFVRQ